MPRMTALQVEFMIGGIVASHRGLGALPPAVSSTLRTGMADAIREAERRTADGIFNLAEREQAGMGRLLRSCWEDG